MVISDDKSIDIAFDDSEEEEEEKEGRGSLTSSPHHTADVNLEKRGRGGGGGVKGRAHRGPQEGGDMEDEGFCILDSPSSTLVVRHRAALIGTGCR